MTDTMNPNKEKRNPKARHLGMIALLVLLLVVAFAASIVVSVTFFSRTTREYREEILAKAAKLAAGQIDGDSIDRWLESGADAKYMNSSSGIPSSAARYSPGSNSRPGWRAARAITTSATTAGATRRA